MRKYTSLMIARTSSVALLFPLLLAPLPAFAHDSGQQRRTIPIVAYSAKAAHPAQIATPPALELASASTIMDGVNLHFTRASEALSKQDKAQAVAELRRSLVFLQLNLWPASTQVQGVLKGYMSELTAAAHDVETGTLTAPEQLAKIFAGVQYALAEMTQQQASEQWNKAELNTQLAGLDLREAIANVEHGRNWVGHKVDDTLLKEASTVADALRDGTWSGNQPEQNIAALGKEVDRLDSLIKAVITPEDVLLQEEMPGAYFVQPLIKPHVAEMTLDELNELSRFEANIVPGLADEVDLHFQAAYDAFGKSDLKTAAQEVQEAVALLRLQTGRAAIGHETVLNQTIAELRTIARAMEKGSFNSKDDLAVTFARAEYAQARHHQLKALESWQLGWDNLHTAGLYLATATTHLEHGERWGGQNTEAPTLKEAQDLAKSLENDGVFAAGQVNKTIKAIGREIKMNQLLSSNEEEFN